MKSKFIIISIILLIVANIAIIYFKTYEGFTAKKVPTPNPTPNPTPVPIPSMYDNILNAMNNLNTNVNSAVDALDKKVKNQRIAANNLKTSFDNLVTLTGIKLK